MEKIVQHYLFKREIVVLKDFYTINLDSFKDKRGNLIPFQQGKNCPFEIQRAFVINNVPNNKISRGNHINIASKCLLIALSGEVTITCKNEEKEETFLLNDNEIGLFINNGVYRKLFNFSSDAILLCLSDTKYEPTEYITQN